jgi:hypothetical protein
MPMMAASAALSHAGDVSVGWVGVVASVAVLLGFMLCGPWLAACAVRRWKRGDDADDGHGFGGGGGGGSQGPRPPDHPPDAEPEWWPEFERDFATYVDRRKVPAIPA